MFSVLSQCCEVRIAGGNVYYNYFDKKKVQKLPFCTEKKLFDKKNTFSRLVKMFISFCNTLVALMCNCDVIIFQDANQTMLYTLLGIIPIKRKKIILIKYAIDSPKAQKAYKKIKHKISGIISSLESVAETYGRPYVLVPDYFPLFEDDTKVILPMYDFAIVGTYMREKDYEGVVKAFSNRKESLIIAGYIPCDVKQKLEAISTENITIVDRYLSSAEYSFYIRNATCVILPYASGYKCKSSGVVLDALYRKRPVLVNDIPSFHFVKERGVGVVYSNIDDGIDEFLKHTKTDFDNNIDSFILAQEKAIDRLLYFVMEVNSV